MFNKSSMNLIVTGSSRWFFSCFLLFLLLFSSEIFGDSIQHANVKAQPLEEPVAVYNATNNNSNMRQFEVTFNGISINTDHDPLYTGEWVMDAYVNDVRVPLWPGSTEVDEGETILFEILGYGVDEYYSSLTHKPLEGQLREYSANISVPDNGEIRIVVLGYEHDWFGSNNIPDISEKLNMNISFPSYVLRAQNTIAELLQSNLNDPNGFVAASYTEEDNFGVGRHVQCSVPSKQAIDVATQNLGNIDGCDFELISTIEEIRPK